MNNKALIWVAVAVVIVVAVYFAWDMSREQAPPAPAAVVRAPVVPETVPEPAPAIRYPIDTASAPATAPLPELDASDGAIGDALAQSLGGPPLPAFVYPEQIIRRFVVTIDNLPRRKASARMMPIAPVGGVFAVIETDDSLSIDPNNSARYALYLNILQRADISKLVDFYVQHYSLFQLAYNDLGYPDKYFNDRFVDAIDDLLAAPLVADPIPLTQPNVLYYYADPELEALSAGQKIMVRMGKDNAAQIKTVLRKLRSELVRRAPRAK